MKTCNIIFAGEPSYTSSTTILDDIRFQNFNNIMSSGISFIVYIIIYRIWVTGNTEKAVILSTIYAVVYIFMQTQLNIIQKKYDRNCKIDEKNLFF